MFWGLLGCGAFFLLIYALVRWWRGSSPPPGSSPLGSSPGEEEGPDPYLEAQRRAYEARLTAWEEALDGSSGGEGWRSGPQRGSPQEKTGKHLV